jgi:hypothetical protein
MHFFLTYKYYVDQIWVHQSVHVTLLLILDGKVVCSSVFGANLFLANSKNKQTSIRRRTKQNLEIRRGCQSSDLARVKLILCYSAFSNRMH